jgi:hypothetical protein
MNQAEAFLKRSKHPHNKKDDFRTPMFLIRFLKSLYGEGLRDGACIEENKKGKPVNVFNPGIIGSSEWIYINPPFDTPSILKFVKAGVELSKKNTVVFLLPNKLCQKGFCLNVVPHFDEIILLGGRINFEVPYSTKGGASMNGCFFGIINPPGLNMKNKKAVISIQTLSNLKSIYGNVD